MTETLLLGFPEYAAPARRLAEALNWPYAQVDIHRFPDGESLVRLPSPLPEHVVLCRSLDQPNAKLVELLLAAETARNAGVKRLELVAPYLCYMRQDVAFHPGEAVSQRIIGRWLSDLFDGVITVDPHLHRIHRLDEVLPTRHTVTLTAGASLAAFIQAQAPDAILIGPDSESEQWVAQIAAKAGMDYRVAEKQRHSDHDVSITLSTEEINDRTAIIVDDVASTAQTLATAARLLKGNGATTIHCCVTHALFIEDAESMLRSTGVNQIWSTDSVIHSSNVIELASLLASAFKD